MKKFILKKVDVFGEFLLNQIEIKEVIQNRTVGMTWIDSLSYLTLIRTNFIISHDKMYVYVFIEKSLKLCDPSV